MNYLKRLVVYVNLSYIVQTLDLDTVFFNRALLSTTRYIFLRVAEIRKRTFLKAFWNRNLNTLVG